MIKTKTFVVKTRTGYNLADAATEELDGMIKMFIEEKSAENPSFKVVNIQYSPTIATSDRGGEYWYPSAMLVYDEA